MYLRWKESGKVFWAAITQGVSVYGDALILFGGRRTGTSLLSYNREGVVRKWQLVLITGDRLRWPYEK
jgi:hypothetical protein